MNAYCVCIQTLMVRLYSSVCIYVCMFECMFKFKILSSLYGLICFKGGTMAAGSQLCAVPSHERVRIAAVERPSP